MIKINDIYIYIYLFNKTQVKSQGLNCTAVFLEVRQMFMHSTSFRTQTPSRAILTSFFSLNCTFPSRLENRNFMKLQKKGITVLRFLNEKFRQFQAEFESILD